MKNNPIEELRDMKVPVTEQEWEAIVHDRRYVKKFGRKAGLSPKGRAALIAGAAAVLITVPILINTLTHKTTETVQESHPAAQTVAPQAETADEPSMTVSPTTTDPVSTTTSEDTRRALPSASSVTEHTAAHEQSTLAAVTEARIPASSQPAPANRPALPSVTTPQTATSVSTTPKNTQTTTVADNKKNQPVVVSNPPKTENIIFDENQPIAEKSQEESTAEADNFFIPTAFTPNGDGLNDLFHVKTDYIPATFEMSIMTRGGDIVFHSRDIGISWDGRSHGQSLPGGIYVYFITYTDRQGNIQKRQGQVMLLP